MLETPIYLLPVKNLTLPSCSPTLISYTMKEFSGDLATSKGQIAYFLLRMRETAKFLLSIKNLTLPL